MIRQSHHHGRQTALSGDGEPALQRRSHARLPSLVVAPDEFWIPIEWCTSCIVQVDGSGHDDDRGDSAGGDGIEHTAHDGYAGKGGEQLVRDARVSAPATRRQDDGATGRARRLIRGYHGDLMNNGTK